MSPATPVALVENATLPGRRVLIGTLAELPALARMTGDGPTTLLFGEVLKDGAAIPAQADALLKQA
jgi:uroporphyrin-III C-methyltransferase/precorrin-2 dehydrogenase/sirohydrochlorin ferrochelatase